MATQADAAKATESVTDYVEAKTIDTSAVDMSSFGSSSGKSANEEAAVEIAPASVTVVANELMVSRDIAYSLLIKANGDVGVAFKTYISS